jgi:hypothetical protein
MLNKTCISHSQFKDPHIVNIWESITQPVYGSSGIRVGDYFVGWVEEQSTQKECKSCKRSMTAFKMTIQN